MELGRLLYFGSESFPPWRMKGIHPRYPKRVGVPAPSDTAIFITKWNRCGLSSPEIRARVGLGKQWRKTDKTWISQISLIPCLKVSCFFWIGCLLEQGLHWESFIYSHHHWFTYVTQGGMMQTSTLFDYFTTWMWLNGKRTLWCQDNLHFSLIVPDGSLLHCAMGTPSGVWIPYSYSLWNKLRDQSCSLSPTKSLN